MCSSDLFHPAFARRRSHLGEEITSVMLEARVHDLMAKRRVLVVLIVRLDPDQRELASSVVGQRHTVIRAASQQIGVPVQVPNTGEDFFKPPENLFQLLYGYRTAPGNGEAAGSLATVNTDTVELRLDHRVDLSQQSLIALRADLPMLAKNPITSSNPNGDYLYGLGDADAQALFVHNFDKRWVAGFGARMIAPTGGDTIGSGKWEIMPIAGLRYELSEVSRV